MLDLADAIDREIHTAWAIFGLLQGILQSDGDPIVRGALHIANEHISKLSDIGNSYDKIRLAE